MSTQRTRSRGMGWSAQVQPDINPDWGLTAERNAGLALTRDSNDEPAVQTSNLTLTGRHAYVPVDVSGGAATITMPLSSIAANTANPGAVFFVEKVDSSTTAVTIAVQTGDKINGTTNGTLTIKRQYCGYRLVGSIAGGEWYATPYIAASGDATLLRKIATPVTAHASTDYAMTSGWGTSGNGAAISFPYTTPNDFSGTVGATAASSGTSAPADVTLTFKDGAFTNIPDVVVVKGPGGGGVWVMLSASATTAAFRYTNSAPTASTLHQFSFIVIPR